MRIGDYTIGDGNPPFVIAEASINHCGNLGRALEMVQVAKNANCQAVKFQTFRAVDVCSPVQMVTYQSRGMEVTEPRINIFRRCELPESAWPVIKAECDRVGILFMSTPETPRDLGLLLEVGIPAIKIGSDNLTNLPMLRSCALDDIALPIILSTGMSNFDEILNAVSIIKAQQLALLACTSQYPCPIAEANVQRVANLREHFIAEVGYSDHTDGHTAAIMAVALGASIIECHFTLSNMLEGPEHHWAKEPDALRDYVYYIDRAYKARGDGIVYPSAAERANKAKYQRAA